MDHVRAISFTSLLGLASTGCLVAPTVTAETSDDEPSSSDPSTSPTDVETGTSTEESATTETEGTTNDTDDTDDTATTDATETGELPELGWQKELMAGIDLGAFMSVWGSAPDDVYAVGGQPEPPTATMMHFDGEAWTQVELPPDTEMLNWVYGVDEQLWAVGRGGTILTREPGADAWTPELSPSARILWGVWGASANELWAVGGNGVSDDPVLLRRDGDTGQWSAEPLPELDPSRGLFKVWGAGADDVWIVGDRGATLHYDGVDWQPFPTEASIDLISVWGSEAEGMIAVGGRSDGRIARFDGAQWVEEVLPIAGLNGIWIDPDGGATAVGADGRILALEPGGFGYEFEDSGSIMVLHAVFGFAGGPRFAVGGNLLSQPPHVGVILREG